jgi:hypothetical protein
LFSSSSSSSSFFFCSNYFAFWQRSIINPPNMHTREREKIACVNHKSTSPTKACPSTCFFLVPHNKLKMMGKEEKRSTIFNQGSIIYISNEEERKEKKRKEKKRKEKKRKGKAVEPKQKQGAPILPSRVQSRAWISENYTPAAAQQSSLALPIPQPQPL